MLFRKKNDKKPKENNKYNKYYAIQCVAGKKDNFHNSNN